MVFLERSILELRYAVLFLEADLSCLFSAFCLFRTFLLTLMELGVLLKRFAFTWLFFHILFRFNKSFIIFWTA